MASKPLYSAIPFIALCLFLVLCLATVKGCEHIAGAAEAATEPYRVLLVFSDPQCKYCVRDKPIVDSMRGKIDMIFFGWKDRYSVKYYKVRSVPTYILESMTDDGFLEETWRTNSAAVARKRLGLAP